MISTVNGHGAQQGLDVIAALRAEPVLADVPVVLGGKIDVSEARQRADMDGLLAATASRWPTRVPIRTAPAPC